MLDFLNALYFEDDIPRHVKTVYEDVSKFMYHIDPLGVARCGTPQNEYGLETMYILLSCVMNILPERIESRHMNLVDAQKIASMDIEDIRERADVVFTELIPFHYESESHVAESVAKYLKSSCIVSTENLS